MPRQKGSKNKLTVRVKSKLENIISKDYLKLQRELDTLTGRAYVEMYLKILEYIIPKAKENEVTITEIPKMEINVFKEEAK